MKANTKQAAFLSLYPSMEDKGAWLTCALPFRTTAYKGLVGPHEAEFLAIGVPGALPQGGQGPEGSPTVTVGMRESAALVAIQAWRSIGTIHAVKQAIAPYKPKRGIAPQGEAAKSAPAYTPKFRF